MNLVIIEFDKLFSKIQCNFINEYFSYKDGDKIIWNIDAKKIFYKEVINSLFTYITNKILENKKYVILFNEKYLEVEYDLWNYIDKKKIRSCVKKIIKAFKFSFKYSIYLDYNVVDLHNLVDIIIKNNNDSLTFKPIKDLLKRENLLGTLEMINNFNYNTKGDKDE